MGLTSVDDVIRGWRVRHAKCGVCGSAEFDHLWTKDGFGYVRCVQCGLVRVDPQLLMSEVSRIYSIGYQGKQNAQCGGRNPFLYRSLLKSLQPYWDLGRILDVGCFTGKFLSAAEEAGWCGCGLELSADAVEYCCSELGFDARQGTLVTTDFERESFDVVTMFDVIEHFQEPLRNLQKAVQLLRPGGLLYIETPNYSSALRLLLGKQWSVFFPWHFYYFDAKTLARTLEMAGLSVVRVQALGIRPLSTFNAFRNLQNGQGITASSSASKLRKRRFVGAHLDAFRAVYHWGRRLENIPFEGLSRLGVYIGGRLIVWAKRAE
jgi:SAM-dependent methyltransferase